MINSRGPSLDPWGTPALTSRSKLLAPSMTVQIFRFVRAEGKSKGRGVKVKMVGLRIIIHQLTGKVISEVEIRLT